MAFNVTYSFNNGAVTGTAATITALRKAIYNYAHSGDVSDDTGSTYNHLTQCTLSGTATGRLTVGYEEGTAIGSNYGLFYKCSSLVSVDLFNLDTSDVTSMNQMFNYCLSLTSVDISSFNTWSVTDMNSMFSNCSNLTNLNLSNLNTSNVTDMKYMFSNCSNLEHIYVSDAFVTTQVSNSSYMFENCTKLPNFDPSYISRTKAIDKSLGGYLELAPSQTEMYYKYLGYIFPIKLL